ncbi:MAG TPA: hypothetical protein VJ999_00965 [Candidatus Sulfotelmatobacter sp.]|nr:hypothetical protein [Candidatus Sulfotelmatobacter sp.]
MKTRSSESQCFAALLILLGGLALYGGAGWLVWLIPAATLTWLAASARCRARNGSVDAQVDYSSMKAVGK